MRVARIAELQRLVNGALAAVQVPEVVLKPDRRGQEQPRRALQQARLGDADLEGSAGQPGRAQAESGDRRRGLKKAPKPNRSTLASPT